MSAPRRRRGRARVTRRSCRAPRPATRSGASTAGCRATSSSGGCGPTSPMVGLEIAAERDRPRARRPQAGRRAARRRGVERPVRPGPHVRQPLRVLLHLPAAQGPAPQPVPEGRRLPAELPVRELHDADPLHRVRPRAGRHRGPVAAARQHPRDRPRRCGPACCATRAARRACAGCGRCSTTASRCAASSCICPGVNDGRGARRHPGRHPRRVPRAELGRRRAARDLPLQPGGGDAPAHARRGRRGRRPPSRTGRTSTGPPSGAGWSTPPTSTT